MSFAQTSSQWWEMFLNEHGRTGDEESMFLGFLAEEGLTRDMTPDDLDAAYALFREKIEASRGVDSSGSQADEAAAAAEGLAHQHEEVRPSAQRGQGMSITDQPTGEPYAVPEHERHGGTAIVEPGDPGSLDPGASPGDPRQAPVTSDAPRGPEVIDPEPTSEGQKEETIWTPPVPDHPLDDEPKS